MAGGETNSDVNSTPIILIKLQTNVFCWLEVHIESVNVLSVFSDAARDDIQLHRDQAATHVHTTVFEKSLSKLHDLNYVVLTGSVGVGKTYTAMSVLDHMISNHPDMTPVIIHSAVEFSRVVDVAENLIVFVDDLGGELTPDDADIVEWNLTSDMLSIYLKDKKLYLILTTHKSVIQSVKSGATKLKNMICSEALIDFDDSENVLTESEKTELCLKYAKSKDIPIDNKSAALLDTGDLSVGFPLLCKLMTRNTFSKLFENPLEAIVHQVNTVSRDAKSHFIVLLLTFLFEGLLPRELNYIQSHCYDRVLSFVKIRKNYGKISDTAEGLLGTVLKYSKETSTYSFVHPGLLQVMMKWLWINQRGMFIELCPIKYLDCLRIETNNSFIEMVPNDLLYLDHSQFNDVLERFSQEINDNDTSGKETLQKIAALKLWECNEFIQTALQYLGFQFFISEALSRPSLFSQLAQLDKHVAVSRLLDYVASSDKVLISDSEFQNAVELACRYGHFNVFKSLSEHCDKLSNAVIIAAAEGGDVEIMKLIATKVHDLNIETQNNLSTIHIACLHGHKKLVQYLYQHANDSVLLRDSKGRSILHHAVMGGNKGVLKFLLANMEAYDTDLLTRTKTGTTLLHTACEHGWLNIVKYVCKLYPSMVLSVDQDGLLPADCAVAYGHVDCLEFLMGQQGGSNDINGRYRNGKVKAGRTKLHLACLTGKLRMAKYLCKTFPDMINSENKESFLPVHDAVVGENVDILDYFIDEVHGHLVVTSDGRTLLHIAAFTGKLQVVKYICLKCPKLLKAVDLDGNTVGHDASASGNVEVLKYLVEQGVDHKARNFDGCSLLHDAAYFGRLDMVKYLCERYPDLIHIGSKTGYSPAHAAALGGSVEMMKYLISSSDDLNVISQDDSTLLHEAAYSGQLKMVQFLCSAYPELISSRTKNSFTPCHYAVQEGHEEVAVFLLGEMCDAKVLTDDNETFLQIATYNGRLKMVKYFTSEFPELLHMVDASGATVLHASARGGHIQTMLHLLELGLDPTVLSENGSTLLHLAAYDGRLEMVKFLCDRFPNMIDITDVTGHSAGHYAAGSGNVEVFKYLIEKGVDPLVQTENGSSCLLKAAFTGILDMVRYLVESFPELLEIDDQYKCSASHYSACEGHVDVLKFLLSQGISPYSRTIDGHTVLHIGAFHGRLEVVAFLCMEYPELIPLEDRAGQTVWTFAESGGHENILDFLRKIKGKKYKRPKNSSSDNADDSKTCCECFRDFWLTFCNRVQTLICFCRQ